MAWSATWCPMRTPRCSWTGWTSTWKWTSHWRITTSIARIIRIWAGGSSVGRVQWRCTGRFCSLVVGEFCFIVGFGPKSSHKTVKFVSLSVRRFIKRHRYQWNSHSVSVKLSLCPSETPTLPHYSFNRINATVIGTSIVTLLPTYCVIWFLMYCVFFKISSYLIYEYP